MAAKWINKSRNWNTLTSVDAIGVSFSSAVLPKKALFETCVCAKQKQSQNDVFTSFAQCLSAWHICQELFLLSSRMSTQRGQLTSLVLASRQGRQKQATSRSPFPLSHLFLSFLAFLHLACNPIVLDRKWQPAWGWARWVSGDPYSTIPVIRVWNLEGRKGTLAYAPDRLVKE